MRTPIKALLILLITLCPAIAQEKQSLSEPIEAGSITETIETLANQSNESNIYTSKNMPEFYSSREKINFRVAIGITLDEYHEVNCYDIYDGMPESESWKHVSPAQKEISDNMMYLLNLQRGKNFSIPANLTQAERARAIANQRRRDAIRGPRKNVPETDEPYTPMDSGCSFLASSKEDAIYIAGAMVEYLERYKEAKITKLSGQIEEGQNEIEKLNEELGQLMLEHDECSKQLKGYDLNIEEDLTEAKEWGSEITVAEVELAEIRARLEETKKQKEIAFQMVRQNEAEIDNIRQHLAESPDKDIRLEEQINVRISQKEKMNDIVLSLSEKIIDLTIDQAGIVAKIEIMARKKMISSIIQ